MRKAIVFVPALAIALVFGLAVARAQASNEVSGPGDLICETGWKTETDAAVADAREKVLKKVAGAPIQDISVSLSHSSSGPRAVLCVLLK